MKIALVTWFPNDPGSPKGGVEAVGVNLVPALARIRDLEIHVVTFDRGAIAGDTYPWEGATVHRLPGEYRSLLRFAKGRGKRLLQEKLNDLEPDIVHAHDTYGIMTRGLTIPRAFTIHGFIHEDTAYRGGLKAKARAWLWKREELATWARQPHIISISPYVRERLKGIATGVIHDIENPIALDCIDVRRKEVPGTIFSAAVICERKNTIGLVEAFARIADRHPGSRLRLAGPVVEVAYGERLERVIGESGLSDRIDLLGSVPASEIAAELCRASLYALVSLEEGAPMGIAEAMAAGVPILTSNRCGMPYMIRHGESGYLVDPTDEKDIATHLSKMLGDPAMLAGLGENARASALEKFHPDRVAGRTLRVYERAVEGSRV